MDDIHLAENTTFLVTGGAGFIGSNIAQYLLARGCKVRVLDNLMTGKEENIADCTKNKMFSFMRGDIRDAETCRAACAGVDYVLHQAALCSVPRSVKNPHLTTDVNVLGTLNMMKAAADCMVKCFVYASSSSVYGDDDHLPKVEEITGTPLSPYAVSKKTNEYHGHNFYHIYGLPTVGLRYFNVFGPRQDALSQYAAVIPIFVKHLLADTSATIHGDGQQSRDFTFIDNVIQANLKACRAPREAFGRAFNIGCGTHTTIVALYEHLCTLLGKHIPPNYDPPRQGDVRHSFANIEKAGTLLGYTPRFDWKQGLTRAIAWYTHNL